MGMAVGAARFWSTADRTLTPEPASYASTSLSPSQQPRVAGGATGRRPPHAPCATRRTAHTLCSSGPSRQRLLRRTDRSVAEILRVRLLCQRSRDTPSTPPPRRARHLAAPLTAATPRDGYKKPPPAPLRTAPPLPDRKSVV